MWRLLNSSTPISSTCATPCGGNLLFISRRSLHSKPSSTTYHSKGDCPTCATFSIDFSRLIIKAGSFCSANSKGSGCFVGAYWHYFSRTDLGLSAGQKLFLANEVARGD